MLSYARLAAATFLLLEHFFQGRCVRSNVTPSSHCSARGLRQATYERKREFIAHRSRQGKMLRAVVTFLFLVKGGAFSTLGTRRHSVSVSLPVRTHLAATIPASSAVEPPLNSASTLSTNTQETSISSPQSMVPDQASTMARRKTPMICLLGVLSGFSGVLCYKRLSMHVHMMTGCMFRVMMALSDGSWKAALCDGAILFMYAAGVTVFRLFDIHHDKENKPSALPVSVAGAALLSFAAADLAHYLVPSAKGVTMAPFLALGFGVVNAFSMSSLGAITNAATGHLTRVSMTLADSIIFGTQSNATSTRYILSFACSVFVTSVVYRYFSNGLRFMPLGCSIGSAYALILFWYSGIAKLCPSNK